MFSMSRFPGPARWRLILVTTMIGAVATGFAQAQDGVPSDPLTTDEPVLEEGVEERPPREGLAGLRFINPRARIALPEPMPGPVLRFVVADDFPPFAFIDRSGRLTGVHIDLIRAMCDTLELPCTIQARRFDRVLDAVSDNPDNLILAAGLRVDRDTAEQFAFSLPYYRYAARFAVHTQSADAPEPRDDVQIGVVENTAHAAFLQAAYDPETIVYFPDTAALYAALRARQVGQIFADGLNLAFWLAGGDADGCCTFAGQPVFSVVHFGEGLTFAVPRGQPRVVQALNAALIRLEGSGELETIMLTAFPLDPLAP